ncbi:methylated-DNA--[protein]-cysteine S-methyltransferase [Rhizobium sp. SL42]|uniref:methylated-DNA--[protein]-cysteine S-methyltransferase n=1 Tax=Rhizobium sp. SL42 TaxID=2806346 RepID=UPI001F3D1BCF|nr:methylated-DNA--[protein]-cysteine S-methyltransferase [Rhizobium sp. SL42]UJW75738.1 methylated-DNA--[protein]-cysteine S-methyltransferase [Rhizobium sp. SL42]
MSSAQYQHCIFETAGGFCGIAWSADGIVRFQLPTSEAAETERLLRRRVPGSAGAQASGPVVETVEAVKRYFAGEMVDFSSVALDLDGQDDFRRDIYAAARKIGWGQTTTYGTLARSLDHGPEVARDVGQAMAKNPVALIIPCHRVLAAGGKLGGFSAPGGSQSKARMLELEGVRFAPEEPAQQSLGF